MIKIIKLGLFSSLSGKTSLTYHVERRENRVFIPLYENSSGGFFCKGWVNLEHQDVEDQKPIFSESIQAIFKGKSANTDGFLLAVLLMEGLIQVVERQSYQGVLK